MFRALVFVLAGVAAFAQPENWRKPFPAHKIAGNLYYVGTEDLACFVIATPEGHILINSGLADSTPLIRESMGKLGFKLEDVKILLTMQAHFDHVAALAEIQKITGAKMYATEPDAPALEDGGKSDTALKGNRFAPIRVDRKLKDGDVIRLGGVELVTHLTPGHSKGSASYSSKVEEKGKTYKALIANMGSVVMPLAGNAAYPEIAEDFARSFEAQKAMTPDIWVAGHASQYRMQEKYKAGSFVDPQGYKEAVEEYERLFRERLARERGER
ncbi:MAG: subclass B3 metallo-beta-lactamase [Bryobacteraceae bacterium]|nr:subclass B3 metallo-beta-lactamase [Bryobacteraceae bacterium]